MWMWDYTTDPKERKEFMPLCRQQIIEGIAASIGATQKYFKR
jgi:hypothetical protein